MSSLFLLDTNILSDLARHPGGNVAARVAEVGENAILTSVIVAAELRYGATKKGSPQLAARIESMLKIVSVLPFEAPADRNYGDLRAELERAGQVIGGNDMLIAAHALALGATLVTDNTKEFSRVRGLAVENWKAKDKDRT